MNLTPEFRDNARMVSSHCLHCHQVTFTEVDFHSDKKAKENHRY